MKATIALYFGTMAIVSLYGHSAPRARIRDALARDAFPASVLFHGTRGIGKQRLALWLAQLLLCERRAAADTDACGTCTACRYVAELRHPDLYWFYPRPRLKDADAGPDDVLEDYIEANAERATAHGLYAPPSGSEGLYVATIRTIVARAALAPAMARRKVFIVGDAERMVSQEGADQAANAFLKLLEEPPADTTLILTSSEPGALLPTIRSRVAAFRCAPLTDADVRAFIGDPVVDTALAELDVPRAIDQRIEVAAGAPGTLFAGAALSTALKAARDLIDVVTPPHQAPSGRAQRSADSAAAQTAARYATALAQGAANARGAFSDMLEALQVTLRDRARDAIARGDTGAAYGASRAIDAVLRAQTRADGNVNPQLISERLMRELREELSRPSQGIA